MKVSTNSDLYNRKGNWIDFNAGQLLEGNDMPQVRDDFFQYVLDVASGMKPTRIEETGYSEISIFKDGVTLIDNHH